MDFSFFDKVYIISVKNSPLIPQIKNEIKDLRIPQNKIKWYITPKLPGKNENLVDECRLCCGKVCQEINRKYRNIYKDALKNNYENIMIFEDDARFNTPLPISKIQSSIKWIKENQDKWDIFYFGYASELPLKKINSDVVKIGSAKLAHAHAINSKCLQKLIHIIDKNNEFWKNNQSIKKNKYKHFAYDSFIYPVHIDAIYAYNNFKKYGTYPSISYQSKLPASSIPLDFVNIFKLDENKNYKINTIQYNTYLYGKYGLILSIIILLFIVYLYKIKYIKK